MKQKGRSININAGGISVMMIVVVLCLSVFAALSVSSAYADLRLADKMKATTTEYYKADAEAQEKIAEIDAVIADAGQKAQGDEAFLGLIRQRAVNEYGMQVEEEEGALHISFEVPVGSEQLLKVKLYTCLDLLGQGRYAIEEYQVVRKTDENYSEKPLDVWDGSQRQLEGK